MTIVGMASDEAVLDPAGDRMLVDIKTGGDFFLGEHPTFPKACISGA